MTETDEISDSERQKLLTKLHKSLFWVGEAIPEKVELEGKDVNLHEIVWEIVNKPGLSDNDLKDIERFLKMLCEKEQEYEKRLECEHLNRDEAKELFDRTAGLRRAIMDMKELAKASKRKSFFKDRHICTDVNTEQWEKLANRIKDREC
ncbi:MAG: DUF5788 family protein [Methanolobus sp.]